MTQPVVTHPVEDFRAKLIEKAQAAKQAAKVGLIPQEQADSLWAQAVEACKPTEESLALAKAAKEKKDNAELVLKAVSPHQSTILRKKDFSKCNGCRPEGHGLYEHNTTN